MKLHIDDANGTDLEKASLVFNCDVLLDGVETMCIMADEENGIVERYVTDEKGQVVIAGDSLLTEKAYGKVEIRKRRDD